MNDSPILVLGGTGKTGKRVARQLTERGFTPLVASRSGERRFDWQDRNTWAPAVAGAGAAYLVDSQGENAAALMAEFAEVAVKAGVRRLVLLSARAWEQAGDEAGFAVERAVRDSGAGWTVLRPTWFAQNFSEEAFLRDPVVSGEVRLPTGEGLEPFIDAEDIAASAVAALVEDGHDGATYALSGPRVMTFGDCVREIAEATGRDIRYVPVSPQEYVELVVDRGADRGYAEFAAGLLADVASGSGDYLSDGVQRLTGREPRDFSQYVKDTAGSGVWQG
ncbi:NmrA family protein [Streptomyces sp. NRRL F-4489]|uniref:NmrA family NAD(P)-binding protein n=1 Tax=Streptomyces sp. NRRL F-4489 TaxID=1609095 RepID=UPI00074A48D5|nr:NAD(P)H-binding protein [Streptomyces sp. NRRL F-4489]KUL52329.1 NmrA family protein [Streptomyces sp. NRRL F-4489]